MWCLTSTKYCNRAVFSCILIICVYFWTQLYENCAKLERFCGRCYFLHSLPHSSLFFLTLNPQSSISTQAPKCNSLLLSECIFLNELYSVRMPVWDMSVQPQNTRGSTHCLLHNYRYKRTPPYRTVVDGPAVLQCQASDVQHPLKDTCRKRNGVIILIKIMAHFPLRKKKLLWLD